MKKKPNMFKENKILHLFFILFSLTFIIPFIYVLSIALSNEMDVMKYGYTLIPKNPDWTAYQAIFRNPTQLIDAYAVTIANTALGTFLALLLQTMAAYPLSRSNFKLKGFVTFYIFFTVLFGGGLIPTYILNTKYLHLGNTFWIYIVSGLVSGWNIIIIRTFFQGIPTAIVESAKLDGASEFTIFGKIIIPLSKPVIATIGVLTVLGKWNDWNTTLIYISNPKLYTLQYLLQKLLRDAEYVQQMIQSGMVSSQNMEDLLPTEAMRFAMAVVAAGPMLVIFPFFQKYFTKGLTVGAVKG